MTVIIGMKFNETDGALIADEQGSYGARKSDVFNKIEISGSLDNIYFIGMTGNSKICTNVIQRWKQNPVFSSLSENLLAIKTDVLNRYLKAKFGLSEQDFQSGTINGQIPIEQNIMQRYLSIVDNSYNNEVFSSLNSALVLFNGKHKSSELHYIDIWNNALLAHPGFYVVAGSGSDVADYELSTFFEQMPRKKRNNLDKIDGIEAMFNAVERASAKNQGVGGIPQIAIYLDGKTYQPSEDASKLSIELVKGNKNKYLPKEFVNEALDSVLLKDEDIISIEEEMFKQSKDSVQFSRFLRGYRV